MTFLPLLLALGAMAFDEQDLPGLQVGGAKALGGMHARNYVHADLNGDSRADLLLPDAVYFQQEGEFPKAGRVSLPEEGACDVWQGRLYVRTGDGLAIFQWDGGDWAEKARYSIAWAECLPDAGPYLFDTDEEGGPEIILVGRAGVHRYAFDGEGWSTPAVLGLLPPMDRIEDTAPLLWPPARRQLSFPSLRMACRVTIEAAGATAIQRQDLPGGQAQYLRRRIPWGAPAEVETGTASKPIPGHLHPCRLDGDDILDFAGVRWVSPGQGALPLPVLETWATLDGGATFTVRRTPALAGFRPRCSFVDFDGDGALDLVTEAPQAAAGGLREGLARALTLSELDHEIAVYPLRGGDYTRAPAFRQGFLVSLTAPPVKNGPRFQRYRQGGLFDLTGDFNGDGFRDLVFRAAPERLDIYRGSWEGFSRAPVASLAIGPDEDFATADVNGDGRSDVVVNHGGRAPGARVRYTREARP